MLGFFTFLNGGRVETWFNFRTSCSGKLPTFLKSLSYLTMMNLIIVQTMFRMEGDNRERRGK